MVLLTTGNENDISLNLDHFFQITYFTVKLFIKNSKLAKQSNDYHISLVEPRLPFITLSILVQIK